MNITRVPVSARARFEYMHGHPALVINRVNPAMLPDQMADFAHAVSRLQVSSIADGFLITESELTVG